jgi:hypothetical protein
MSRRSLRPQLNQIRGWVRQGRTDAWIAHQLEVTVQQIQAFKREQDLEAGGEDAVAEDVDLRAEDDEQIAAELEAEAARRAEEEAKAAEEARIAEEAAAEEAARKAAAEEDGAAADEPAPDADADAEEKPRRPRRRGGRTRRRTSGTATLEGTFDHGEEGYGLWLDPAVQDDAVYAEHWAGHRPVEVTIEEDRIVIRRAGTDGDDDED